MTNYLTIILTSYQKYWNFLTNSITTPSTHNYFYYLLIVSAFVWILEIIFPWRKKQSILRKGFWVDLFYIFFNFFIFSLIIYNALSNTTIQIIHDIANSINIKYINIINIKHWPLLVQIMTIFLLSDFIQWLIHILLHRYSFLWKFHKVHHSVKEMGFAAHFRFHFMETIIYKSILYFPLALLDISINNLFLLYAFTILIGHLNHANIPLTYGPLKYILNNPAMHIWHHDKKTPITHPNGVNFGITLSIWDYLFGTAYIPRDGRDIKLGFTNIEQYPQNFLKQITEPFKNN